MANLITVPRYLSVSQVDLHHYTKGGDCKHPILLVFSKQSLFDDAKRGKIRMTMHVLIIPCISQPSCYFLFACVKVIVSIPVLLKRSIWSFDLSSSKRKNLLNLSL